ncbi:CD209 antigen-like protein D isoform X2 [Esox lucius]|uniref:C-type lectin domain-containing protein n=1 Tax=Esox lucius TaxID=8010 RepID=A0AAY5KYB0_ESOLU|nr:CD209 antigen-like protein D isoform X2 [Esox lucius]
MSEGIYKLDRNVIGTHIDSTTYANVGDNKPKPASVSCQWWRRPSGVAALCLGLLCLLLLAGIIGLFVYYGDIGHQYFTERDKLQKERDIFQKLLVTSLNGCKVFGNSIYYVSTEQNTWEYAGQDCRRRGAQLVIINNQEEQRFLNALNIQTWIGLSDIETEGTWRWVDGTNLTTAYWGGGEPNNLDEGEDCAVIYHDFTDPVKKWNDTPCTRKLNWICEKVID